VVFGCFEGCHHYHTGLMGLPKEVWQDVEEEWDDFHGVSDLQRDPMVLKAKADGGHAFAQYVYALRKTDRLPKEYRIAPVDIAEARKYYGLAAKQGMTRAQAVVASYIQRDLQADPKASVDAPLMLEYAKAASEANDPLGRRVLADIKLAEAKATNPPDREKEQEAYQLLLYAAERGTRSALRKVGELYFEGRQGFVDAHGEPILVQNFAQGIVCFEQAALARDFEACCRLGEIYEENKHADRDPVKSYAWYLAAVQVAPRHEDPKQKLEPAQVKRQKDERAKLEAVQAKLKDMADRLSPSDLAAAQNLARSFLARMPTEKENAERTLLKAK
jgi:TPR repeat protein